MIENHGSSRQSEHMCTSCVIVVHLESSHFYDEAVSKLKFGSGLITRMEVSYAVIRAVACMMLGYSIHKPGIPADLIVPLSQRSFNCKIGA